MKRVTVENFRQDKLYPGIRRAVAALLDEGKPVTPVEVLVRTERLSPRDLKAWRSGGVSYLEQVIRVNLSKASRILRILRMHAHELNLAPSIGVYSRRKRPLRFSKSGEPKLEEAYRRHYIRLGRGARRAAACDDLDEPNEPTTRT